eukprot:SAG31_NODE_480_length_15108_cov_56.073423_3_plen_144_part_00
MAADAAAVADEMIKVVESIPELELLTAPRRPDAAIVPITTTKGTPFTIYQVASQLEARGWNMFTGQKPPCMSACIGEQHTRVLGDWISDLHDAITKLRADPSLKLQGHAAVYGVAASVPDQVRSYFLVFVPTIREIRDFYREM